MRWVRGGVIKLGDEQGEVGKWPKVDEIGIIMGHVFVNKEWWGSGV